MKSAVEKSFRGRLGNRALRDRADHASPLSDTLSGQGDWSDPRQAPEKRWPISLLVMRFSDSSHR